MKILLVSTKADGAWFVWLLGREGHKVDWIVSSEKDADSLAGIVPKPLSKAPSPDAYDLIVFDSSGMGDAADAARTITPTIGASALADRLEHDRVFGIEFMEQAGIKVPPWEPFDNPSKAIAWLEKHKKRTVLKPFGDALSDATYVSKSAEDMIAYIKRLKDVRSFVLQEFISGVEVSTEGWWTGKEWTAVNHDLEEKKFMPGGLGPNTGCSASAVWMLGKPDPLFQQGLDKAAHLLEAAGFVGIIDLNTIVTEGEAYALEWTPRFGYEGTCNFTRLLNVPFSEFLYKTAIGETVTTTTAQRKFATTIRLSVPPYPNAETSRKKLKVPVDGIDIEKLENFVLYDVLMDGEQMVTGGTYNVIGSPMGVSESICGAFEEVEQAIKRVQAPNLQWRNDVKQCIEKRYNTLQQWGWFKPIG